MATEAATIEIRLVGVRAMAATIRGLQLIATPRWRRWALKAWWMLRCVEFKEC